VPSESAAAGALAAVEQSGGPLSLRVADVFSERALLAGKMVRVAGVAAKVTPVQGIWYLQLKDGSGTPGKDDALTVITASEVKVDAKVTVEGRVALNRDVGLGAPYPGRGRERDRQGELTCAPSPRQRWRCGSRRGPHGPTTTIRWTCAPPPTRR
jgi:hypothetical protein